MVYYFGIWGWEGFKRHRILIYQDLILVEWGILTTFLGLQPDESFDKCFSSDSDISSSFTPPSPSLVPCGTQVQ